METVVKTGYGEVRGGTEDGVAVFKGLPYAAPPFGERRLQPPGRPEPWDGVRDALAYGPTAPHGPYPAPFDRLLPEPIIPGAQEIKTSLQKQIEAAWFEQKSPKEALDTAAQDANRILKEKAQA